MRKLTVSFLALAIAFWGQTFIRNAAGGSSVPVRDGLILLAVAGLIFALNAGPQRNQADGDPRPPAPWPLGAWALTGTGVALSALAALLFARQIGQGPGPLTLPSLLWLAGVLIAGAALLWSGKPMGYALPPVRWGRDAAGRFVRLALDGHGEPASDAPRNPSIWLWVILVLLVGMGLRLWQLTSAPPACVTVECAVGLRILDWSLGRADLAAGVNSVGLGLTVLGSLLFGLFEPGTATLRVLTALLGILTLPGIFLVGRRVLNTNGEAGGALLAMLLLAVSPMHLWFSRSTTPLALVPPLLALHLWAILRAGQDGEPRWYGLVGLTWGLIFIEAAPFRVFLLLWLMICLVIWLAPALLKRAPNRPIAQSLGLAFLSTLAALLPGAAIGLTTGTLLSPLPPLFNLWQQIVNFSMALLQPGALAATTGLQAIAFLDPITASLGTLGLGLGLAQLVRGRIEGSPAGLLLILSGGVLWLSTIAPPPGAFLLVLTPLAWAGAAVGLGEIWGQFAGAWRPLVKPSRALAGLTGVTLLIGLLGGAQFVDQLADTTDAAAQQSVVEAALGRYIAATLAAEPGVRILVPAEQLTDPATQLALAGANVDMARLIPLDPARHLPFAGTVSDDLIYIISNRNPALLASLQQVYPAGVTQAQIDKNNLESGDAASGAALFVTYRVPVSAVESAQGLQGSYFTGRDFGTPAQVQDLRYDGPLRFDWSQAPPLDRPFSVVWTGSLLVRTFGPHTFRVDIGASPSGATGEANTEPIFSLELDGVLVLDTSLGVSEKRLDLAEGLYRVQMVYRSSGADSPPADLAVTWETPAAPETTLPRDVLYSVTLPDQGLLGSYFATSDWSGPVQSWRKDQVIGPDRETEQAYSVVWRGKLAAPLAGSYLLSVVADGASQILVDGQRVLENQGGAETTFRQGSITLANGWHNLEIRYAPGVPRPGDRQFALSWQPPGGIFDQLSAEFLRPLTAATPTDGLALPDLPVADGQPQLLPQAESILPAATNGDIPQDLPALPLTLLWQAGAQCGPDADQFNPPRGVAVDALAGRVYVADAGNRQIKILDLADGSRVGALTSDLFEEPFDLDLSAGGDLWILDSVTQQTFRAERASGQPLIEVAETTFYRPRGMSLDRSGLRYVADTGGSRIVAIGPNGDVLGQFGGPDSALGQGQPVDVLASEGGALWAVTAEDGGLWRADLGSRAAGFSKSSSIDGPHLAGLPDSTFFLTEPEQRRVVYFSAQGVPLAQLQDMERINKPIGIDARIYGGQLFVAVSDVVGCSVSLYGGAAEELP